MPNPVSTDSDDFSLDDTLSALSKEEIARMKAAGEEVATCQRVLRKTSSNVVADVLRNQGTFYQWNHYPKGDTIDWETHSQYYYHAHPKEERPDEHGHFHTFLRYDGMPEDAAPLPLDAAQKDSETRIGSHLCAICMDKKGYAVKLFTTNRWVTDETWYPAEDMVRMVDRFIIDHTFPSWATNRWISAAMILFAPQVKFLLRQRDARIATWRADNPGKDVFEDRRLEVTSELPVSADLQRQALARF